MPFGQSFIARCYNDSGFPKATDSGTLSYSLPHRVSLADIGTHFQRILRVGAVQDINAGAINLRPRKKPGESCLGTDQYHCRSSRGSTRSRARPAHRQ